MSDVQQMMEKRKVCVVVPTYNNGKTIAAVVKRIAVFTQHIIIVIDGCTDDTREQLKQLSDISFETVDYAENKGKGYALLAGFQRAKEEGFDYAITIDSDGQHYPEDIPLLMEALESHPGALIVGARNLQEQNMPGGNTFANRFSNFWFTIQTGIRLPDTQTGFRLYPLKRLSGTRFVTSRYEAELELLVFAAWAGVELVSVPVRVFYPSRARDAFPASSRLYPHLCAEYGALFSGSRLWLAPQVLASVSPLSLPAASRLSLDDAEERSTS